MGQRTSSRRSVFNFKRFTFIVGALLIAAAVAYVASLINHARYYLVVESTRVRVTRGSMFPFGDEPFVPLDPRLRKAYTNVQLPSGLRMPQGRSTFTERPQLDQALYRLLMDAAQYSLAQANERTPTLMAKYLAQIDALPSLSAAQQARVSQLRNDAAYVEAQALLNDAREKLKQAEAKLRRAASGGGRYADAGAQAAAVRRALMQLDETALPPAASALRPPPPAQAPSRPVVRTATTSTTT